MFRPETARAKSAQEQSAYRPLPRRMRLNRRSLCARSRLHSESRAAQVCDVLIAGHGVQLRRKESHRDAGPTVLTRPGADSDL